MDKKFGLWLHFLRVNLAFLVISAAWGFIGLGFLSVQVGAAFFFWSLFVGPIVITLALMVFGRIFFRLSPLSFRKQPGLQKEYLECLLKQNHLNLQVWVRPSDDLGIFWWEGGLSGRSKTRLVVTTRWLKEPESQKAADFRTLWREISALSKGQRLMRNYKMALWWGSSSLFDFFLLILRAVLDTFNFSDIPSPGFWMQRFSWFLYAFAFGLPKEDELLPRVRENAPVAIPRSWNYVFFAVWMRYPSRLLHPTWIFFTHASTFIFSDAEVSRS
jgi:hypothetical protein